MCAASRLVREKERAGRAYGTSSHCAWTSGRASNRAVRNFDQSFLSRIAMLQNIRAVVVISRAKTIAL